jgi:hypothetical protein
MKRIMGIVVLVLALAGCGGKSYRFNPEDSRDPQHVGCGAVEEVKHGWTNDYTAIGRFCPEQK